MFLKSLIIKKENENIRSIKFHKGLNLIIDETPSDDTKVTGNNIGKTTVLKLIDFCLGAKQSIIYSDTETKKEEYKLVKEFLQDNNVVIILTLVENLDDENSKKIVIERNFLSGKKAIRLINGEYIKDKDFEKTLLSYIFPNHRAEKPTFRQIISHNIRYKDENINNTLKTLNSFSSDAEYETLYLFLLGCNFDQGAKKQEILAKIKQEKIYKDRLEKKQTKNAYEVALSILENEIEELENKKNSLNINPNFEQDLERLNQVKYFLNRESSKVTNLKIRRDLINDSKNEILENKSDIDLKQLRAIYEQATDKIDSLQKTFDDLVHYHNNMVLKKVKFITEELPDLEKQIDTVEINIKKLLEEEKSLTEKIAKSDSFSQLEEIIATINEKYRQKGEYENIISQLTEAEENLEQYNNELNVLDKKLFSDEFEENLKKQINIFNRYFSTVSNELYGERYALKYDKIINKNGQQLFKFSSFNTNLSSGKKQGEILCFDLAYTIFADEQNIPTLHFLLNDKKELMHDNQLIKVAEFLQDKDIQLVISILKDKLPNELNKDKYFIVRLSQNNKLFKIENNNEE